MITAAPTQCVVTESVFTSFVSSEWADFKERRLSSERLSGSSTVTQLGSNRTVSHRASVTSELGSFVCLEFSLSRVCILEQAEPPHKGMSFLLGSKHPVSQGVQARLYEQSPSPGRSDREFPPLGTVRPGDLMFLFQPLCVSFR